MASNDGDILVGWVGALKLRNKSGGTDCIECSNTEEALWVVDVLGLEDLGTDRDSRVDLAKSITTPHKFSESSGYRHTGFEMTRTLASEATSATALARSRTMDALVLNRSIKN